MAGLGKCFTSINTSCTTEALLSCGETIPFEGATIQTVTAVGYASDKMFMGCSAKAGVTTTLTRKYDCDLDKIVFLCNGAGSAYEAGNTGLVTIGDPKVTTTAMSMSVLDPVSLCCSTTDHTSGYGLSYTGGPISFSTSEECTMLAIEVEGVITIEGLYLQSFSLNMASGQLPVATYTLLRQIK